MNECYNITKGASDHAGALGKRLRKAEILAGKTDYVRAWFTGHNEVTRITRDGARIVRFEATDILWIAPSGRGFRLDNGGRRDPTMVSHLRGALDREVTEIMKVIVGLQKCAVMQVWVDTWELSPPFRQSIEGVYRGGQWAWVSDLD